MSPELQSLLGMHANMSNDDYHNKHPGWSSSHIKKFAEGPKAFYDEFIDPPAPLIEEEPPTLAERWAEDTKRGLILGEAIHLAILQPDLVPTHVVQLPPLNLRTNAGRAERDELLEEYAGKCVLTAADYQMMLRCRDAAFSHPVARRLLDGCATERSYFAIDPETGELVKCRPDAENDRFGAVVDLKSTTDASMAGFGKQAANLRYEFQPPWYIDTISLVRGREESPEHWAWVVVEKELRPRVEVYFQKPEDVASDRATVRAHFEALLRARNTGEWELSSTSKQALPLEYPAWARKRRDA